MGKRLLLLGGTSFFGRDIARLFHEAGYAVTIFTRGSKYPSDLPPCDRIVGDRNSHADLLSAARAHSWDVVVDNLAYTGDQVALANEVFVDVGRYLLCSTVSVYRFCPEKYPHPLVEDCVDYDLHPKEEDPTNVHWKYARGKLAAERTLRDADKLRWTILRPPVVYGPDDPTERGFWYLARMLDGGPTLLPDGGVQTFRLVGSHDCARAFLLAAQRREAANRVYNVAQRELITLRGFLEEAAQVLGLQPDFVSVPAEILGDWGGPWAPMAPFVPSIERAEKELSFRPQPFQEWAKEAALWFRDRYATRKDALLAGRAEERAFAERWRAATAVFRKAP